MSRGPGALTLLALLAVARPCSAQQEAWHTLDVPSAAFQVAGVEPNADRSQSMLRLIRVLHSLPADHRAVRSMHRQLAALLDDQEGRRGELKRARGDRSTVAVPLPLAPKIWADVVFQKPVASESLFSAIIRDRNASLLYVGLCALTPHTRAFLSSRPDLLRWVHRERAGTLAAFGSSFRLVDGRLDVPGGAAAEQLWEALTGESVANPAGFMKAVLGRDDGRLAYLYEAVDVLDGPRQRLALGLVHPAQDLRIERLETLYRAVRSLDAEWSHLFLPFARPTYDPATLLNVARATPHGALAEPAARALWNAVFESTDIPSDPSASVGDVSPADVAAIADLVVQARGPNARRERLETFAFAQRVFGSASREQLGEVLVALRGFIRFPAVMLSIERIGVTAPAAFAAMARHADAIERVGDVSQQLAVLGQFQATLAILDRLRRTGALPLAAAERLIASLAAMRPDADHGYAGRVAAWITEQLIPALDGDGGRDGTVEQRLIAAFADVAPTGPQRMEWEGIAYEVGVAASDVRRIEAIRAKQGGNSLDAVLAFARDTNALAQPSFSVDGVKPSVTRLRAHADALRPARPWPGMTAGQVPNVRETVNRAARGLTKIRRVKDAGRAAHIAEPLLETADYLLGEVLVSLAYAPLLGDAGSVLGGEADIAHRHDFGVLTGLNAEAKRRLRWLRPRQPTGRSVVGALTGVDLALASHTLRRLATDRIPKEPRLKQNDRDAFITSLVLMNPRHLDDAGMRSVASAVRIGRALVRDAGIDLGGLDHLAGKSGMSSTRRQLLAWAAAHDPAAIPTLFSIAELLRLGTSGGGPALEPFGLTAEPLTGCFCRHFPDAGPWETYSGRPATGQLATRIPDLVVRVTELLDDVRAPAALLPAVMSLATQDFLDEVSALYADDWEAAVAYAHAVTRERVEDYVASLTAGGPLRPLTSNQQ